MTANHPILKVLGSFCVVRSLRGTGEHGNRLSRTLCLSPSCPVALTACGLLIILFGRGASSAQEPQVDYHGRTVSQWIEVLRSPDPQLRCQAAYALGQIGPQAQAALPALLQAFQSDQEIAVRQEAAYA